MIWLQIFIISFRVQQVSKTASVFEVSGKGIELLRRRLEMERFTALTYRDMSQFDPVIRVAEHKLSYDSI